VGVNFFPLRGTNSKAIHYLLSYFSRLNTLKVIAKPPVVELLRLNTLGVTKTALLTPKSYDAAPSSFLYPRGGLLAVLVLSLSFKLPSGLQNECAMFTFTVYLYILHVCCQTFSM